MKNMNKVIVGLLFMLLQVDVYAENKQQIHLYNRFPSDVTLTLTWREVDKNHTQRIQDISIKKGKSMMVKAPISSYKLDEISAMPAAQVAEAVAAAVAVTALTVATLGAGDIMVPVILPLGAELGGLMVIGSVPAGFLLMSAAGYVGAKAGTDVTVHKGKVKAHDNTYFSFVDGTGMKDVYIVSAKTAPGKVVQPAKKTSSANTNNKKQLKSKPMQTNSTNSTNSKPMQTNSTNSKMNKQEPAQE